MNPTENMASLIDSLDAYLIPSTTVQHRLFHGRGGTVPALGWLTVDCYPPVLLATLFALQDESVLVVLRALLEERLGVLGCDALVIQHRYGGSTRNEVVTGSLPKVPVVHEQGLQFLLDFERGQNIGFFPDMVPGRQWLAERAQGKNVLNLFSFTCAFSVVARAAGAEKVVNIDLSKPALSLGQRNHEHNQHSRSGLHFLPHDIFRSWKKLQSLGCYDIIIVDPPSEQKGSFMARKDYAKVMRHLHRLLKPQADILVCLNAPWLGEDFLDVTVQDNLDGAEKVARLPFAPGYVEADEQAGLKVVHYRYQRPQEL